MLAINTMPSVISTSPIWKNDCTIPILDFTIFMIFERCPLRIIVNAGDKISFLIYFLSACQVLSFPCILVIVFGFHYFVFIWPIRWLPWWVMGIYISIIFMIFYTSNLIYVGIVCEHTMKLVNLYVMILQVTIVAKVQ